MPDLSEDQARRIRLRSQRLDPRRQGTASVDEVVASVCGLQAQAKESAALAVRVRSRGLLATDVDRALHEERSLVRTWCMRGTNHLVPTDDLPWLLQLFGSLFVSRSRRRLAQLGFNDEATDRAVMMIRKELASHGPLTRAELAACLQRAGIAIDPKSQAPIHLIRRAALLGLVCEVAPRRGRDAYWLLRDWVKLDRTPDRNIALAELARRYLRAHQPAAPEDFSSWSGLTRGEVRVAWSLISDELDEVRIGGRAANVLKRGATAVHSIGSPLGPRLLPAFDDYWLGYKSRAFAVAPRNATRVRPGGGMIRPIVIVDGRAVANWMVDRSRKRAKAILDAFDGPIEARLEPQLAAEVEDVGRFLGVELALGRDR